MNYPELIWQLVNMLLTEIRKNSDTEANETKAELRDTNDKKLK